MATPVCSARRSCSAARPRPRIEQGLRDRYQAGIFRIKDLRQQQDAYRHPRFGGRLGVAPMPARECRGVTHFAETARAVAAAQLLRASAQAAEKLAKG